jgi:hypothetical protein
MTTNRTPIGRSPVNRITPRAIEIFRQIIELECTEPCSPFNRCANCEEAWRLDCELHRELKLKPWQGCPTIIFPDEAPTHPRGSPGGQWQRRGGPELFRMLSAAAGNVA